MTNTKLIPTEPEHLRYGGSTAARTMNCKAWRKLADTLGNTDDDSEFAQEGNVLHDAMEAIYIQGREPIECIGMKYKDATLTHDLYVEKLLPAVAAVEEIMEKYDINDETYLCESKTVITEGLAGGTADLLGEGKLVEPDETYIIALVLDYKFGYNSVSPKLNEQMFSYSGGAMLTKGSDMLFLEADIIIFAIVQPNDQGPDWETWEADPEAVETWTDMYQLAIADAESCDIDDIDNYKTGDWCKYCPAAKAVKCPKKNGVAAQARMMDITSTEELEAAMVIADDVITWGKAVKTKMHEALEAGTIVSSNWKLVPKRATRVWNDPNAAMKMVRLAKKIKLEQATTSALKSPAQMEKLCKAIDYDFAKFEELISKVSSGTTLAAAEDERSAVPSVAGLAEALEQVT